MSLIEEALRRVKDPLVSQPKTQTTKPEQAIQSAPPLVHSWSPEPSTSHPRQIASRQTAPVLIGVALAVLGFTALLLIGGGLWLGRTLRSARPAESVTSQNVSHTAAPQSTPWQVSSESATPKAKPLAQISPPLQQGSGELVLSGVVEGTGESYAMINGTIVGVGEQIGQSTLVAIANGVAKLRRANGTEIELRVPR
jgi:hypothetical protein